MEFKEKLKQLRRSKNLSQQQLADDLFVSRSMIAKYEAGIILPTIDFIEAVSKYFKVEISSLLNCPNEISIDYKYFKVFMAFHNALYWLEICIYLFFVVFSFLPIFNGHNLFVGAFNNHSPMMVVAFSYSIVCIVVLLVWKFVFKTVKSKMIASIFTDFSFFIGSFLLFVGIVMGIGGA